MAVDLVRLAIRAVHLRLFVVVTRSPVVAPALQFLRSENRVSVVFSTAPSGLDSVADEFHPLLPWARQAKATAVDRPSERSPGGVVPALFRVASQHLGADRTVGERIRSFLVDVGATRELGENLSEGIPLNLFGQALSRIWPLAERAPGVKAVEILLPALASTELTLIKSVDDHADLRLVRKERLPVDGFEEVVMAVRAVPDHLDDLSGRSA
jgi:hypothetical protein